MVHLAFYFINKHINKISVIMYQDILKTKTPDNKIHILTRYINFITDCVKINTKTNPQPVERHHICPKAKDLFPKYSSLSLYPWNRADLTPRQHYIAHWMLFRLFGGSQTDAFWRFNGKQSMSKTQYKKIGGKTYEILKAAKVIRQSALMLDLHKNHERFSQLSRTAAVRNNQHRKENGIQSQVMLDGWKNGKLREGQQRFWKSEAGQSNIQNSINNLIKYSKTPERSSLSRETILKSHSTVMLAECPHCKITITKAFGNYKRHVEKCNLTIDETIDLSTFSV